MIRNAVLVVTLGVTWGLNWPMVRLALTDLPPLSFRAIAFSAAALVLFGAIALRGESPAVPRQHWPRLVVVGMLSVVAYNLFSAFAQLSASTSRSAVLSYTMPIWAVLFARLVLGELFDRRRIVGLALGSAGLLALGLPLLRGGQLSWGLFYAVMSGVVWAAGSVILKRWPIDAGSLVITAWQIALGAVVVAGAAAVVDGVPPPLPSHGSAWLGLAYNVFIGQALATTLWFTILARMPAGLAAIGSLLVPGIGVVGATLILREQPTLSDWTGLVLIVAAAAAVLLRGGEPSVRVANPPPPATDCSPAPR